MEPTTNPHLQPEVEEYEDGRKIYWYSYHHLRMAAINEMVKNSNREKMSIFSISGQFGIPTRIRLAS